MTNQREPSQKLGGAGETTAADTVPGAQPVEAFETARSADVEYSAARATRTGALAWIGLGFALVGALLAATQVLIVLREVSATSRFGLTVRLQHFVWPALGIVLATPGWKREAKRWRATALVVAALSILTLLLLSSRTWGKPSAAGQSPWHWPDLEWGPPGA